MKFDLRPVPLDDVRELCAQYHGYQSAGGVAVYSFGVIEVDETDINCNCVVPALEGAGQHSPNCACFDEHLVVGYTWQPPPPGAARSVCPEAPHAVLALSRMVAVPKELRQLKHVSKPLMVQMKKLIDRTRWPVLVTYSDEGEGHTGYVYQCSGWEKTTRTKVKTLVDAQGRRVSRYANGKTDQRTDVREGFTWIQRWEHRVCERGIANHWLDMHGWKRVAVPGKKWASGNQAYCYERRA